MLNDRGKENALCGIHLSCVLPTMGVSVYSIYNIIMPKKTRIAGSLSLETTMPEKRKSDNRLTPASLPFAKSFA